MEKVSIIIVTYNRLDMLKKCLAGIRKNTNYPYEMILIDNGSDRETADYIGLQGWMDDVWGVYRFDNNAGFARGFSKGLAMTDCKYRIILNSDTVPYKGWLDRLVRFFDINPDVGIVLPYTNYACNPEIRCDEQVIFDTQTKLLKGDVPAICWMISRKCYNAVCNVIEKLGGGNCFFHSDFEYGWAEDILTSQIIRKLGFDRYVIGKSFIYHFGMATQAILKDTGGFRKKNMVKLKKYLEELKELNL